MDQENNQSTQDLNDLDPGEIVDNLDELLAAGVDVNELVERLDPLTIVVNFELSAAGAQIDVDELVEKLESRDVVRTLDRLFAIGAQINVDELVKKLDPYWTVFYLDVLLAAGADRNMIQKNSIHGLLSVSLIGCLPLLSM